MTEEFNYNEGNWRQHALCRSADTNHFFLEGRGVTTEYFECRLMCFRCPVQRQCLDFAVGNAISDGLWGGLSYRQRLAYARGDRESELSLLEIVRSSRKTMTIAYLAQKLQVSEQEVRKALHRSFSSIKHKEASR